MIVLQIEHLSGQVFNFSLHLSEFGDFVLGLSPLPQDFKEIFELVVFNFDKLLVVLKQLQLLATDCVFDDSLNVVDPLVDLTVEQEDLFVGRDGLNRFSARFRLLKTEPRPANHLVHVALH